MRLAIKLAAILVVCPLLPSRVSAATWYVDRDAVGANDGSSWANAWSSFAAIHWTTISAGDTLYISGGADSKTYTEAWQVGASGRAGAPITIAIDATNPAHHGVAVFDFDSAGDRAEINAIQTADYVRFSGDVAGENHLRIANLRNVINEEQAVGIYGYGLTGAQIDHVDFVNCNNPIRLPASTGIEIRDSQFLQTRGDSAIRMILSTGSWDANRIHDNTFELLTNGASPPDGPGCPYVGPDGIQPGNGVSIYRNRFRVRTTTVYTSCQHPDMVQVAGGNIKIYDNEFMNIGDSAIDYDAWAGGIIHSVWIYNNVFRIVDTIDPYPEFIRVYSTGAAMTSITDFKIVNNLFLDNGGWTNIVFSNFRGNPAGSGLEISNNIFYNSGGFAIDPSTGFDSSSWTFDGNAFYPGDSVPVSFGGSHHTGTDWVTMSEPHGSTGAPSFVSYTPRAEANDLHLAPTDTVARDHGVDRSMYFNEDFDGVARPQGAAWDKGPYEACVGAHCAAGGADAGVGADGGAIADGGTSADGGASADAGARSDAGASTDAALGNDASHGNDASARNDASSRTTISGGCSCRVAKPATTRSATGALVFVLACMCAARLARSRRRALRSRPRAHED